VLLPDSSVPEMQRSELSVLLLQLKVHYNCAYLQLCTGRRVAARPSASCLFC
jgi:hypothetical protein